MFTFVILLAIERGRLLFWGLCFGYGFLLIVGKWVIFGRA